MNQQDIRWKQRFQNYDKAFQLLQDTLQIKSPSKAEQAGRIKFDEMAFELAWKVMKDYLQEQGHNVTSPRDAIKQSFQDELIMDGHQWIEALMDRNLTVHTYDEAKATEVEQAIRSSYFPLLRDLHQRLKPEIEPC
jgi:nucleotidyltransferase substrate binding protein (TIGR01987 family)